MKGVQGVHTLFQKLSKQCIEPNVIYAGLRYHFQKFMSVRDIKIV